MACGRNVGTAITRLAERGGSASGPSGKPSAPVPDRFDAAMAALERGDIETANELEMAQRARRSDWQGRRKEFRTRLPEELAERVLDLAGATGQSYSEVLALIVHDFFSRKGR